MAKEKAFISQPMLGLTDEEILTRRNEAKAYLESHGYEVIDSFITDTIDVKHEAVAYLARSLSLMADASIVYFLKGWELARGCRIEEKVASQYGICCMYETYGGQKL